MGTSSSGFWPEVNAMPGRTGSSCNATDMREQVSLISHSKNSRAA